MKSLIYKETLYLIDESNPLKSSVKFVFYFSHLQFLSAKNDLGGEHKILSVFVMIVGELSIKYCMASASTELST